MGTYFETTTLLYNLFSKTEARVIIYVNFLPKGFSFHSSKGQILTVGFRVLQALVLWQPLSPHFLPPLPYSFHSNCSSLLDVPATSSGNLHFLFFCLKCRSCQIPKWLIMSFYIGSYQGGTTSGSHPTGLNLKLSLSTA